MEYETLADIVEAAHEFYGQSVSSFGFGVWEHALRDFELPLIAQAFQSYMIQAEGKFCPKPSDIVEILRGNSTDNAKVAWVAAINAVKDYGAGKSVIFDDSIIHRVIADLGGWIDFCMSSEKDLPFMEKRFVDCYKMYRKRPTLLQYPPRLIGHVEAFNNMSGYQGSEFNQVVLIGDQRKCIEVATALPSSSHGAQSVNSILSLMQLRAMQSQKVDDGLETSVQNRGISDE